MSNGGAEHPALHVDARLLLENVVGQMEIAEMQGRDSNGRWAAEKKTREAKTGGVRGKGASYLVVGLQSRHAVTSSSLIRQNILGSLDNTRRAGFGETDGLQYGFCAPVIVTKTKTIALSDVLTGALRRGEGGGMRLTCRFTGARTRARLNAGSKSDTPQSGPTENCRWHWHAWVKTNFYFCNESLRRCSDRRSNAVQGEFEKSFEGTVKALLQMQCTVTQRLSHLVGRRGHHRAGVPRCSALAALASAGQHHHSSCGGPRLMGKVVACARIGDMFVFSHATVSTKGRVCLRTAPRRLPEYAVRRRRPSARWSSLLQAQMQLVANGKQTNSGEIQRKGTLV
ncbi:hypothetical protein BDU57DRAFT_532063 [Ampelomyces quisqualis]|uniref:Uncharacterized protein n=1 Tax=Ampelomyces quisqualis TaxID=50730 RepID=A0A6A5QFQ3_AMPQU|nr:hypothetical protein BDU57DRAFT_532063 [Ampelomyces quisqualis]